MPIGIARLYAMYLARFAKYIIWRVCIGIVVFGVVWALITERITAAQFTIIVAACLLFWLVILPRPPSCQVRPFSVPKALEEAGWTPEVVARRFVDALSSIASKARSVDLPFPLEEAVLLPEIEVPGTGLSFAAVDDALRFVLKHEKIKIIGEIVPENMNSVISNYAMRIRGPDKICFDHGPFSVDTLRLELEQAATKLVRHIAPYHLAISRLLENPLDAHMEAEKGAERRELSKQIRLACRTLQAILLLDPRLSEEDLAKRAEKADEVAKQAQKLAPSDPFVLELRAYCLSKYSSSLEERERYRILFDGALNRSGPKGFTLAKWFTYVKDRLPMQHQALIRVLNEAEKEIDEAEEWLNICSGQKTNPGTFRFANRQLQDALVSRKIPAEQRETKSYREMGSMFLHRWQLT